MAHRRDATRSVGNARCAVVLQDRALSRCALASEMHPGVCYAARPMAYPLSMSRVGRATAACVAVALVAPGCTSMRELRTVAATIPPAAYMRIKPGDRVDVEMKDGRQES